MAREFEGYIAKRLNELDHEINTSANTKHSAPGQIVRVHLIKITPARANALIVEDLEKNPEKETETNQVIDAGIECYYAKIIDAETKKAVLLSRSDLTFCLETVFKKVKFEWLTKKYTYSHYIEYELSTRKSKGETTRVAFLLPLSFN